MKKRLRRLLSVKPVGFAAEVIHIYFDRQVSRSAAQLAYFLVLTFFPILICLSAFMSKLDLTMEALLESVHHLLPAGVVNIFRDYLGYLEGNSSTAMLLAGIFLMVLFASAAIRGLMSVVSAIYGHTNFRGLHRVIASVLFALFLLFTVYLSMAVILTGNWFFRLLGDLLGLDALVEQVAAWQWVKYVLLLAVVFLFILLLYRFCAPLRRPRPMVIPGAALAAVALAAASAMFSLIMSRSTRYDLVYGSLASVIILLVWLYLCGNILVLGSAVNYVIDRRRDSSEK